MFEDFNFEAAAHSVALLDKARRAVEKRRYTDRPGDGWTLTDCAALPQYTGVKNKVMISTTADGEKYEVIAYTYAGRQLHSATYKTLDAAFRNGVKFADQRFEVPAPKAEEPKEPIVEAAPVVEESVGVVEEAAGERAVKVYERTENGVTNIVERREGLAEINRAMMEGKRDVRTMWSISRTDYAIEYKDGRSVRLFLVDAPEPAEEEPAAPVERTALIQRRADGPDLMGRVVTVKGKDYVVEQPREDASEDQGAWEYVDYWSERAGMRFGATRTARPTAKPGTVARAIWDAVNE
ncbi:hypothetical protein [Streptomyces eurythermus]